MAKKLPTVWPLEPHTLAKQEILRRYLQAWMPILGRHHERIVYIDGFAGPGIYEGGHPGSPIIALKVAIEHAARISDEMVFLFIEQDTERAAALWAEIAKLSVPPRFRCYVEGGRCAPVLNALLDSHEAAGGTLAPTFAFLDPFGYSHTPMALIARLLSNARCEVLVTFMYEEVNRFLSFTKEEPHFDQLFGTPDWREARKLATPVERVARLRELYKAQLHVSAGGRYVFAFEMRNAENRVDYYLFFATNNLLGVKKMKEAMWKVDQLGGLRFSDATDPSQTVMFAAGPDAHDVERRLRQRFGKTLVPVGEMETFLLTETPYRETHFKKLVLRSLELRDPPGVVVVEAPHGRKKGMYPAGTLVRFL